MPSSNDPLHIRASSRFVMSRARHVRVNRAAADRVAASIAGEDSPAGEWEHDRHWDDTEADLANYVLVLDALNFCFWDEPRWRIRYDNQTDNGYWALTAALRRALEDGYPIMDARYLRDIPVIDVARMLAGESIIPLFASRVAHLREVGDVLLQEYDGSFANCLRAANGSAVELLRLVIASFPCFVDVGIYQGRAIPFYKRAQILVSDVAGALRFTGLGEFHDLSILTAFADYKVPQVLHQLGVLDYSPCLTRTLSRYELMPRGSESEIEIRAGTIHAVEVIRESLQRLGHDIPAYQIDWYLWNLGQALPGDPLPYHRTLTSAY